MTLTTSWFDRNESLEQIICQVEVQRFVVKSSKTNLGETQKTDKG